MGKTCFKCGETKPLNEFYKHRMMKDGHLNKCKDCTRKDVLKHRQDNSEKVRAYDRMRGNRQTYAYTKEYRRQNPEKAKAHNAVNHAMMSGKIIRPKNCVECGSEFSIEAHHEDYSKPLEVVWLCSACHKRRHYPLQTDMAV